LQLAPPVAYSRVMEMLTQDEILRLSPAERLALIEQLWDSLDEDQVPIPESQRTELDRRLESIEEDRRNGITWASLKAKLEQRCP